MSRYENVIPNPYMNSFNPHVNRKQSGVYGSTPVPQGGNPNSKGQDLSTSSNGEDSKAMLVDTNSSMYPIDEGEASQMLGHIQRGIQVGQQMENLINGMVVTAVAGKTRHAATVRHPRVTGGNLVNPSQARGATTSFRRSETPPPPPDPSCE